MKIYLVRHGVAEERSPRRKDSERKLTKKGKRRTRQAMRGLAKLAAPPELILSSPLVRAWETAKILARSKKDGPRVEAELAPGGDPASVLERLRHEAKEGVALVGHEPDLSELARHLTGGTIELGKAGAALVEGTPGAGQGRLIWLATPLLLRRLAR